MAAVRAAALEGVSYLGHALPGIVVGLSLVFSPRVVPGLYQSAAVLCFAYAVLFLPKAIGATRAAVERTPPAAEEVARTLGRSALSTWSAVTMRHAAPGRVREEPRSLTWRWAMRVAGPDEARELEPGSCG
ncbi:ABC transporter permease subunit [Jiangella alkaliphila]|uniref:ABC transporter permease subunit n=1 Tax=Jiangella alkaliphila TaxID=419479 RepID=UPI00062906DC|nr:ABC transporter permease subunit [Jiangella alkaliphila]